MSVTGDEPQPETTIECLNDDCLMHVFQYLTMQEKIDTELVCKNWKRVGRLTWSHIKNFDVAIFPFPISKYANDNDIKKNTNFCMNILKRGGSYIVRMAINTSNEAVNFKFIVSKIPTYCCNIKELYIWDPTRLFNDENLKTIFLKNTMIKKIKLGNLQIKSDCLLYLDANNIEEICIQQFQFESKDYYHRFLANLRNLKVLKMVNTSEIKESLEALLMSKCDKITEIEINLNHLLRYRYQENFVNALIYLLTKQKNIAIVKLRSAMMDSELLEKLPLQLQEVKFCIGISDNDRSDTNLNLTSFLSKRPNIQSLFLENVLINERFTSFHAYGDTTGKILETFTFRPSIEQEEVAFDLSLFLSRHKIRKINLYKVEIDEKLMVNFPKNVEELNLHLFGSNKYHTWSKYFKPLQNLLKFSGVFVDMTKNILQGIINYINPRIKQIKIEFYDYWSLGDDPSGLKFSRLQDLESFIFKNCDQYDDFDDYSVIRVDYILQGLSACNNLKMLSVTFCNISEIGFKAICNLTNLIKLEMSVSKVVGDELFSELIKKLLNLKELIINNFDLVTHNLIKIASEIKCKRGDTQVLKIDISNCDNFNFGELKDKPLVQICDLEFE